MPGVLCILHAQTLADQVQKIGAARLPPPVAVPKKRQGREGVRNGAVRARQRRGAVGRFATVEPPYMTDPIASHLKTVRAGDVEPVEARVTYCSAAARRSC